VVAACRTRTKRNLTWKSKTGMFQTRSRHIICGIIVYLSIVVRLVKLIILLCFSACLLFHYAGSKVTMSNHQEDNTGRFYRNNVIHHIFCVF
jgi:hypothetical protein